MGLAGGIWGVRGVVLERLVGICRLPLLGDEISVGRLMNEMTIEEGSVVWCFVVVRSGAAERLG